MHKIFGVSVACLLAVAASAQKAPDDATLAKPLKVGQHAPNVSLLNLQGQKVKLKEALGEKPTVLIFYRGSWCPFCNAHLADLAKVEGELRALGYQLIALSPDKPSDLAEAAKKNELNYTLYSDSSAAAMHAFGVAWHVDDDLDELIKGYGVDVAKASGENHRILPVPSVFIIDPMGKIRYAYSNADYKIRLKGSEVLHAAKAAVRN